MVAVSKKNISRRKSQGGGSMPKIVSSGNDSSVKLSKKKFQFRPLDRLGYATSYAASMVTSPFKYLGTHAVHAIKKRSFKKQLKANEQKLLAALNNSNPEIQKIKNTKAVYENAKQKVLNTSSFLGKKSSIVRAISRPFNKKQRQAKTAFNKLQKERRATRSNRSSIIIGEIEKQKQESNNTYKNKTKIESAIKILEDEKTAAEKEATELGKSSTFTTANEEILAKLKTDLGDVAKTRILSTEQIKAMNSYVKSTGRLANVILKQKSNTFKSLSHDRAVATAKAAYNAKYPLLASLRSIISSGTEVVGLNWVGKKISQVLPSMSSTEKITKSLDEQLQKANSLTGDILSKKQTHDEQFFVLIKQNVGAATKDKKADTEAITKYKDYNDSINKKMQLNDELQNLKNMLAIIPENKFTERAELQKKIDKAQSDYNKTVNEVVAKQRAFLKLIEPGTNVNQTLLTGFKSLLEKSDGINSLVIQKQRILNQAELDSGRIINERIRQSKQVINNPIIIQDRKKAIASIDENPFNGKGITNYKAELQIIIAYPAENITTTTEMDNYIKTSILYANDIFTRMNNATDTNEKTQFEALYNTLVAKNREFTQARNFMTITDTTKLMTNIKEADNKSKGKIANVDTTAKTAGEKLIEEKRKTAQQLQAAQELQGKYKTFTLSVEKLNKLKNNLKATTPITVSGNQYTYADFIKKYKNYGLFNKEGFLNTNINLPQDFKNKFDGIKINLLIDAINTNNGTIPDGKFMETYSAPSKAPTIPQRLASQTSVILKRQEAPTDTPTLQEGQQLAQLRAQQQILQQEQQQQQQQQQQQLKLVKELEERQIESHKIRLANINLQAKQEEQQQQQQQSRRPPASTVKREPPIDKPPRPTLQLNSLTQQLQQQARLQQQQTQTLQRTQQTPKLNLKKIASSTENA